MSVDDAAILAARAERLARPIEIGERRDALPYLTFGLGRERYALAARFVWRVVPYAGSTPLPQLPAAFRGVVNAGGHIVPLVDLAVLLGASPVAPTEGMRVVVVGGNRGDLAVLADGELGIVTIPRDELGSRTAYEPPVQLVRADALIVIDGAALLADRRLFVDHVSAPEPQEVRRP